MNWGRGLFIAGLVLWALLSLELVAIWAANPDVARAALIGMGVEIATGREGGVPTSLQGGVPPMLVFQLSATQDIASAFLVYPLFLTAYKRSLHRDNLLVARLRRIEEAAHRHQAYVRRWGPLGIGLFMLVPFLINGPMVGMVLGRVAGIRTQYVIAPVVLATIVAAAVWTFAFDAMFDLTDRVHPMLGLWITIVMVAVVVTLAAIDVVRQRD